MSEEIIIPPAHSAATGFVSRSGSQHNNHGHHDYAHTAERVIGSIHNTERNLESNSRNFEARVSDGFSNTVSAVSHSTEEMHENYALLQKQVSDSTTATVVGFKDAQATAYQVEGRALLEAAKNANALSVQATANFNLVQIEQVKNAAASALTAAVNQATTMAAIAACCCETKELIRAENGQTRDLINANTVQNLRDVLFATQRLIPVTVPAPV